MIVCFSHSTYQGKSAPLISCKTCCHIFIKEVKRCRDAGEPLPLNQRIGFRKHKKTSRLQANKMASHKVQANLIR